MAKLETLITLDTTILLLNLIFIYLYFKFNKFYFINLTIIINSFRLFYSYLVFGNSWWLKHSIFIFALLLVNFFDTKKITKFINSTDNYLRFLIVLFFLIFTFKENFMILHPGISGWTYENQSDFINSNSYEIIENSSDNLILKNQIIASSTKKDIRGFKDGYMHIYLITVAKTNIGDIIFNEGDYHFVFPNYIFNRIEDKQELLNIQIDILEKTLCHRINGKRFLINRSISYADHSPYFKLNKIEKNCNDNFKINAIQNYTVYSNIFKNKYEVRKVEIQN